MTMDRETLMLIGGVILFIYALVLYIRVSYMDRKHTTSLSA